MKVSKRVRYYRDRWERRARRWKRRSFGDEGVSISLDAESESETLLLTFGGMKSLAGLASFEFVALTETMPVKRMFVRDPRQSWYHRGMPQHGATLASVAESLGDLVEGAGAKRLVVAGNSAGGYAALLFGTLLGADLVLAFAPQTTIDPKILGEMGDHRWDEMLAPLIKHGALEPHWTDLRAALPGARLADTRYKIFFDEHTTHDRLHAERLSGLEGARLYRFGRGGHVLVRHLRDVGALDRLLRAALGLPERLPVQATAAEGSGGSSSENSRELRFRTHR
jgi:hypothetical protein